MAGAWSGTPATYTPAELITDTILNAEVRDRFLWLGGTAGVITQRAMAIGLTSNPTIASTTLADLDGNGSGNVLRIDMTTSGGDVLVIFNGQFSNGTANDGTQVGLLLDAVGSNVVIATSATANANVVISNSWLFLAPSSAAHVIKAQWATAVGGTSTASGVLRSLIAIELRR